MLPTSVMGVFWGMKSDGDAAIVFACNMCAMQHACAFAYVARAQHACTQHVTHAKYV